MYRSHKVSEPTANQYSFSGFTIRVECSICFAWDDNFSYRFLETRENGYSSRVENKGLGETRVTRLVLYHQISRKLGS